MKPLRLLALAFLTLHFTGCVAMIATSSAEKQQERKLYTQYVERTEGLNIDREKAGLPPRPVLPFKDWQKTIR